MLKITLIPGLCAVAAFAQTISITAALAGPTSTISGAPYQAQAVTQRVQTLADGNRITQTTTNAVARDSKGRLYREESLLGFGSASSEPPHLVLIEDPVASTRVTLDSNSKTAMRMVNSSQLKKTEAEAAFRNGMPPMSGDKVLFNTSTSGSDFRLFTTSTKLSDEKNATTTDLGTQVMEGVSARGTKVTGSIPAGAVGNEMPLVITTETWLSPELKVMVMTKSSDPRMGETTYKLTNISRAEPDPALFQIPADYTVKDQTGGGLIIKKLDN